MIMSNTLSKNSRALQTGDTFVDIRKSFGDTDKGFVYNSFTAVTNIGNGIHNRHPGGKLTQQGSGLTIVGHVPLTIRLVRDMKIGIRLEFVTQNEPS